MTDRKIPDPGAQPAHLSVIIDELGDGCRLLVFLHISEADILTRIAFSERRTPRRQAEQLLAEALARRTEQTTTPQKQEALMT